MSHRSRRAVLAAGLALAGAGIAACVADRQQPIEPPVRARLSGVTIISRETWGALPLNLNAPVERGVYDPALNRGGWRAYDQPLDRILRTLVVHHSALSASDGPREIQRLHRFERGYADIGYHFLIDPHGAIYEGRAIGVRGVHVGGFNTGSVGACLLGNFERIEPAAAQLASLEALTGALRDAYGITHLAGHRDFQPGVTVCPGANLAPMLPTLAPKWGLTYGTGGYMG